MRKTFRALVTCAVLAMSLPMLALAACGDEEADDSAAPASEAKELPRLIQDGTLTVASDIPFPPFEMGDPPRYEGFDVDVVNAVADQLGLEVRIVDTPFDILLQGGKGRFDVALAAISIKEKREQRVDFSDPYFLTRQSLLVRKQGDFRTVDDLDSDTVVGVEDGTVSESYASDETEAKVRAFPEFDDANNALANGQVDAVINDLSATQAAAKDNPSLEVTQSFDTGDQYGILLPEGSEALLSRVNQALKAIKADGTLDTIHRRWFKMPVPERVLTATHQAS